MKIHSDPWKGLAAGLAGGLAGALAAGACAAVVAQLETRLHCRRARRERKRLAEYGQAPGEAPLQVASHAAAPEMTLGEELVPPSVSVDDGIEPRTKGLVPGRLFGCRMSGRVRQCAGAALATSLGMAVGSGYGVATEYGARIGIGHGVPFGIGLMVIAEEAAAPALGLARPLHRRQCSDRLASLIPYAVFGIGCEFVRRIVRESLE